MKLAINGELVNIPDAVQWRLGRSAAIAVPVTPTVVDVRSQQAHAKTICAATATRLARRVVKSGARVEGPGTRFRMKKSSQTTKLGHQEEPAHQEQVEGEELHRHVIGHVEGEDLNAVRRHTSAPSVAVAGIISKIPARTSADPANIS